MVLRMALLMLGVFCCSTAVIMIKASTVHPVLLAGYRLTAAALLLSPLFIRAFRQHRGVYTRQHFVRTILPAGLLALHFITWVVGARATLAANASLIVNLTPIVMPFILFMSLRERVHRGEIVGTAIAMTGVLLLAGGDYTAQPEHLFGDAVCFGSMLFFAVYLVLARRNRDVPSLWLYITPLYAMAGLFCFALAPLFTSPWQVFAPREYLLLLGLALIPTIAGHGLLNHSMRHLRGQVVSICNLHQFVFAGILGFIFFREAPPWTYYPACALIVCGAVVAIQKASIRTPRANNRHA